MNDELPQIIFCQKHGSQPPAFVCDHLLQYTGKGFFVPDGAEEDSDQAWCEECDDVLAECGGWTDEAADFANFRLVCAVCFKRVKAVQTIHLVE